MSKEFERIDTATDGIKADAALLATKYEMVVKDNERLRVELDKAHELHRTQRQMKQALYIYLDGSTQIKPPMVEPASPNIVRPVRYYRAVKYGPVFFGASDPGLPIEPPRHEYLEFRLIAETSPYYIYEQVR